jgi:hypothetical protein
MSKAAICLFFVGLAVLSAAGQTGRPRVSATPPKIQNDVPPSTGQPPALIDRNKQNSVRERSKPRRSMTKTRW